MVKKQQRFWTTWHVNSTVLLYLASLLWSFSAIWKEGEEGGGGGGGGGESKIYAFSNIIFKPLWEPRGGRALRFDGFYSAAQRAA